MFRSGAVIVLTMVFVMSGCATTGGKSPAEKRSSIQSMKNDVLTELFEHKPGLRNRVRAAPGYAVFKNANVNVILASFGGGYGLAKNNKTGETTYMKMGEVGVGLGMGVKDFRVVFVFNTKDALDRFIDHGWAFGAQADAAAKAGEDGAAVAGEATIDDVTIYQITENGLALQATVKGTKYWRDESIN